MLYVHVCSIQYVYTIHAHCTMIDYTHYYYVTLSLKLNRWKWHATIEECDFKFNFIYFKNAQHSLCKNLLIICKIVVYSDLLYRQCIHLIKRLKTTNLPTNKCVVKLLFYFWITMMTIISKWYIFINQLIEFNVHNAIIFLFKLLKQRFRIWLMNVLFYLHIFLLAMTSNL